MRSPPAAPLDRVSSMVGPGVSASSRDELQKSSKVAVDMGSVPVIGGLARRRQPGGDEA